MRDWDLIEDAARPHVQKVREHLDEAATTREDLSNATDSADAAEAGLSLLASLNAVQTHTADAIEAVTRELLAQRVPQTQIAEAAGVTRQTVVRWKQAMKAEAEQEAAPKSAPLFED